MWNRISWFNSRVYVLCRQGHTTIYSVDRDTTLLSQYGGIICTPLIPLQTPSLMNRLPAFIGTVQWRLLRNCRIDSARCIVRWLEWHNISLYAVTRISVRYSLYHRWTLFNQNSACPISLHHSSCGSPIHIYALMHIRHVILSLYVPNGKKNFPINCCSLIISLSRAEMYESHVYSNG